MNLVPLGGWFFLLYCNVAFLFVDMCSFHVVCSIPSNSNQLWLVSYAHGWWLVSCHISHTTYPVVASQFFRRIPSRPFRAAHFFHLTPLRFKQWVDNKCELWLGVPKIYWSNSPLPRIIFLPLKSTFLVTFNKQKIVCNRRSYLSTRIYGSERIIGFIHSFEPKNSIGVPSFFFSTTRRVYLYWANGSHSPLRHIMFSPLKNNFWVTCYKQ